MGILVIVLGALLIALSIFLIAVILMQSEREAGLGSVSGGGSGTYWSKNKGRSKEGTLEKYTKIGGALFLILSFAITLIMSK